jgi:hypothetical protein
VLLHGGVLGLVDPGQHRFVEAMEPDLARQVGDHRVAVLRRGDEPVEALAQILASRPGQRLDRV